MRTHPSKSHSRYKVYYQTKMKSTRRAIFLTFVTAFVLISFCQNALSQESDVDNVITATIENMQMTLFEFKGEFDRDPRNVWAGVCNKFI
mmetsp:Transcript_16103/g.18524  ORF Transcript_16103/g.18524 Transcript_16103/m.18524 type:complete len:90 (-) Transcript_16103:2227-2496(-)